MPLSPTLGFVPVEAGAASGLRRLWSLLAEPFRVARARAQLRHELSLLDYRELRDLGISEGAIDGFVATWTPRSQD
jgi:uncharacterized protein YjiS (DUF1127 family)